MPRRVTTSQSRVSDIAFRKQVAATQEALKTFNTIAGLNAPGPARVAMEELISVTVRSFSLSLLKNILKILNVSQVLFSKFIPEYLVADSLRELCPAALAAINKFAVAHPTTRYPDNFSILVDLVAHIEDSVEGRETRGTLFHWLFLIYPSAFSFLSLTDALTAIKDKLGKESHQNSPCKSKYHFLLTIPDSDCLSFPEKASLWTALDLLSSASDIITAELHKTT